MKNIPVLLLGSAASLFCFSARSKYWARQIRTYPSRAAALTGGEQRGPTDDALTPSILMRVREADKKREWKEKRGAQRGRDEKKGKEEEGERRSAKWRGGERGREIRRRDVRGST